MMEATPRSPGFVQSCSSCWAGNCRLSIAWWGFGVGGSLLILVLMALLGLFLMAATVSPDAGAVEAPLLQQFLSGAYFVFLGYQLAVAILVWRNAKNTDNLLWGWVARGLVAAGLVVLLIRTVA